MNRINDEYQKANEMRDLYIASPRFCDPNDLTNSDYSRHAMKVNPLLVDFPTKCVQKVKSDAEARELITKYSKGSEITIVQYSQGNCMSCNAVAKISDFLCHSMTRSYPKLRFLEVNREDAPEITRDMVRFPQVKGYSQGQSTPIDFKPPSEFRDETYARIKKEIEKRKLSGKAISALQAEEMYYSMSAPAMAIILEESICTFYTKTQAVLHNYWGQISKRRSWFYKKFIAPTVEKSSEGPPQKKLLGVNLANKTEAKADSM